jgi:catechol 2,3-dioxygenase-like lactoylglutathione lyase family enzyme
MQVTLNHAELTMPKGSLTKEKKREIVDFYRDVLGFEESSVANVPPKYRPSLVGRQGEFMERFSQEHNLVLRITSAWPYPVLVLTESETPIDYGTDGILPHLGVLLGSAQEVRDVLRKLQERARTDPYVEFTKAPEELAAATSSDAYAGFYFKYRTPFWWDVHYIDRTANPPIDFHDRD